VIVLAVRLYRLLLRLRPAAGWARRHDGESEELLEALLREARRGGRVRLARVAASALLDAAFRLGVEWWRAVSTAAFGGLAHDVRHSIRAMRRRPLAAIAGILTVALGIGLNAAVFSIFDWVLLRPLPYPRAERLVAISSRASDTAGRGDVTYSEFDAYARAPLLQRAAAVSTSTRVLSGPGLEPAHVAVARVSGDLLGTLAIAPLAGRGFEPDEMAAGAPVVLVGHRLWRDRLGSDRAIAGRTLALDGSPYLVAGVLPPGAGYPASADLWLPVTAAEREDDDRESAMIGRLADGASATAAAGQIDAIAAARPGRRRVAVEPLQRTDVKDVRVALSALAGFSVLILLMTAANLAALTAARASERTGELAVRAALGARASRVRRHVIVDTLLISTLGGAAGLLLGEWALRSLIALAPVTLPRGGEIALDARILLAGALLTLATGAFAALHAVRRLSRIDLQAALVSASSRAARVTHGRALLAVQASLAVLLTANALLLGRSLQRLVAIRDGFAADTLMAVDLSLRGRSGDERVLFRDLIAAAEAVPGVKTAAVALLLPTRTIGPRAAASIRGLAPAAGPPPKVVLRPVTAGYFATVGIPLLDGRVFAASDTADTPLVAVINAAFARETMHGAPALGAVLTLDVSRRPLTVVGVAADITPGGEADRPAVYVLSSQLRAPGGYLLVRGAARGPALTSAVAGAIARAAPSLARDRIHFVASDLARGRALERFSTQLAAGFAGLALLLAAVGVYGLLAGELTGRLKDIAIRLALGGSRTRAFWSVMGPVARALGWSTLLGLAGAVVSARYMASLLHGVGPADPLALVTAPLVFLLTGGAAAALAAARMRRANPIDLLRQE
jgi:predicted permease